MTSDFNQVIKRRWRFELPELPISRPVTRQAPKTPKCKNKLNEYTLNVHDYSRPVTHHQVRTCNKPTTAKQEVFNVGGVNVIDYQFLIPKRFESGDYKVCLGYNIKNPPAKEGYCQDGYVIPWKTPEVIVKPKFQYLKKKSQNQRLVKTPAIKFARLEEEDGNKDENVDVNSISVEYVEAGTAGQAEHVSLDDADMEHMQLGHSRNEYVQSGNVKGRNLKGETIKAGNIKEGAMKGVLNGQNGTSENLISGNVREVFGKLGNGKGEHTKVDNHVEFDLSDAQFRREDTFLPMIPATPKIKPRKKLQRDYSVPKFDDILVDKVVARQKAKEMAEKQKQLIANALKHYADNFKEQNLFVDMNVISQLKENVRDALLNEHVSPKSRQMIFKSILEGNDLENILNIAPEMSRPINEFDDLAERDAVMMYKLPTPQHAEETFIPETYRRKLSSTIKVQHKTLVPTRKAAKKEELKHSEEQGNTSKFFRDFQTLLDRQHKIEGEAVAMIGNIQTHLETRQIARYPIEDLLKLIWHQYCHLKDSYEEIVPTEVAQAFYTRLHDFPYGERQHAEFIKEQIKTLNHRCFIYLKAFTGHMKRIVGVCSESVCGGPQRLCMGLAKLFGSLIFRMEMPATNDVYIPPILTFIKIDFSDGDLSALGQNENKTIVNDNFWDDEEDKPAVTTSERTQIKLEGDAKGVLAIAEPVVNENMPTPENLAVSNTSPGNTNIDTSKAAENSNLTNVDANSLNHILDASNDDPLLRQILNQHGLSLGDLSKDEKAIVPSTEVQNEQASLMLEQEPEKETPVIYPTQAEPTFKPVDLIEKHKMELKIFGWDDLYKEDVASVVFKESTCLNAFEMSLHIILLNWDSIFTVEKSEESRPSFAGQLSGRNSTQAKITKGALKPSHEDEKLQPHTIHIDGILVNGKEMAVESSTPSHNPRPRSTRAHHYHSGNQVGEPHLPQLVATNILQRPKSTRAQNRPEEANIDPNTPFLVIGDILPSIEGRLSDSLRPSLVRSNRNSRTNDRHRPTNGQIISK